MGAVSNIFTGLGLGAISTGLSTAAAYRDAQAQNAANELTAQNYDYQAQLSGLRAQNYRRLGETEYGDVVREYRTLQGDQRVGYGASGVSVNAGSAAAVQANTAAEGVYEAQKTQYQRDLQAWQAEQEAASLRFNAARSRSGSVNPYVPAATAAIGGLTGMYSTYGQWYRGSGN